MCSRWFPVLGPPERGKGVSLEMKASCLKKEPLKTTQRSSVLEDVIGVLEGRKGEYDLC
jgi:hypothetical protein